jgi:hypothetical protein
MRLVRVYCAIFQFVEVFTLESNNLVELESRLDQLSKLNRLSYGVPLL